MRYLFFLIVIVSNCKMYAQSIAPGINVHAPRIFPSTPNSNALTKYSGVGVLMNTGMINYQLPIWNFQCNDISVPVIANYSSGGIKVDEYPTNLGMTWSLNAGGVITRQLNGAADETATRMTFNDSTNLYSQSNYNFVTEYYNPAWRSTFDTQPDIFTFKFGNYSGKFILDNQGNPLQLPHSNLKIKTAFNREDYTFIIVTPTGDKYFFGGGEATEFTYSNNSQYANSLPHPSFIPTAYYLTKIISIHGETVNFAYDDHEFGLDPISITQINNYVPSPVPTTQCITNPCPSQFFTYRTYVDYKSKLLKKISNKNFGEIIFEYEPFFLYGNQVGAGEHKLLKRLKIVNNIGLEVRKVDLLYEYVTTSQFSNTLGAPAVCQRPFLKQIQSGPELYTFKYYNVEALPVFASFAQDYFGYFNGAINTDFISNDGNVNYASYPMATANRTINHAFAKSGLLNTISFPTGGRDSIVYEGNYSKTGYTGGLRVNQIFTIDKLSGTTEKKKYYYAPLSDIYSLNVSGTSSQPVLDKQMVNGGLCDLFVPPSGIYSLVTCTYFQRTSSAHNDLNTFNGYHISYQYVTESHGGDNFENGGIEHSYHVANNSYSYPVINGSFTDAAISQDAVTNGLEHKTRIFKKKGTEFVVLTETDNHYKIDYNKVNKLVNSFKVNVRYIYSMNNPPLPQDFSGVDVMKTTYHSKWVYLDSVRTKIYTPDGVSYVEKTEAYSYDNPAHAQINKVESKNSKGNFFVQRFNYPHEKSSSINNQRNIYNDMVDSNYISPVIEKTEYLNDSLLQFSRINFDRWLDSLILPRDTEEGNNFLSTSPVTKFHEYSATGKILSYSDRSKIRLSVIYGYNNTMPIAKVVNAEPIDIAITSFESDDKSNWIYVNGGILNNEGVTGKNAYSLSGGNVIQRTALNPTRQYTITFWQKNGSGTVSLDATALLSKNEWTLYRIDITGVNDFIISGNAIIDELRLLPSDAQMITFTYDPMIGMTSQCDINNFISYYEYDVFGRLKLIRDQDKNIIKTFQYNYQQ